MLEFIGKRADAFLFPEILQYIQNVPSSLAEVCDEEVSDFCRQKYE